MITVRAATRTDLTAVVELLGALHDPPTAIPDMAAWDRMLEQDGRTVLLAELNGTPAGTADGLSPDGWDSWEAWATENGIPEERWNDQSAIVDPDGTGPRIYFQKVPESKAGKNRVHLDVRSAPGLDGDARRARLNERADELVALGATRLYEMDERGSYWVTMQDPEGNEFCLD